jgi:hypothetical protein
MIDIDSKKPNLALMKLSAYHKAKGDQVELTGACFAPAYDKIYVSKVFSWTTLPPLPENVLTEIGGSGCGDLSITLPAEIESLCPDYSLYLKIDYSLGFLTRGCIRRCPWCIVPEKEGDIRPAADIEDFLRHDKAVLLDNNVLACEHGIKQIEKIVDLCAKRGLRVDFNQGLDARLIDDSIARLLARVRWMKQIRLACDSPAMMAPVERAVELLRKYGATPKRFLCYMLVGDDLREASERADFLKQLNVNPFAQPYRGRNGEEPTREQRDFARWVNIKSIFWNVKFEDYKGRVQT